MEKQDYRNSALLDGAVLRTEWLVRKFHANWHRELWGKGLAKPFEVRQVPGNLLLNEGITALANLLVGNAEDNYGNANAYLGVGDDNTAASASQTGLQASSNKAYVAMASGYPSLADQTVTWRAVFTSGLGNFAWKEFTVASGNNDSADNLNRKVSDQGTKAEGQEWTLDLAITFS